MFADEIRLAIEASSRITLPAVAALLWRAYGEGNVTEAEAEALSGLIDIKQSTKSCTSTARDSNRASTNSNTNFEREIRMPENRQRRPVAGVGSRPVSGDSLERRRRWAASGRLPPALAARFTLAEQAVLALVAAETARRGDCRLSVGHLAAVVGVAETTVRNAIREARKLGLLTVEERRLTGFRNDTNVVRIVSPEWVAWLRPARKGVPRFGEALSLAKVGGCKSPNRTSTQISKPGKTGTARPPRGRIAVHRRVS